MKIHILGAHNIESLDSRCVCLLIDDVLAIDAGALTSGLSFAAQQQLKAVLLTHQHYDHIRDIPALGMNLLLHGNMIEIYSTQSVYDALAAHLLNDSLYPNYLSRPPEKPAIRFKHVKPGRADTIAGYSVLPVPVHHAVPTVGYQITSQDGKVLFYTSDTGPGLADCFRQTAPDLLIIEVTALNKYEEFAYKTGHLTPVLLQDELETFRKMRGYLPQVVTVHMNPLDETELAAEIAAVAGALDIEIRLGHEGMEIEL
jgi:ribonuclease BN (tRNA processing enzyme)